MLPYTAIELYNSLIKSIKEFKSPAYREFFERKAHNDFENLKNKSENGRKTCVVEKYVAEQNDLLDVLKRQSVIFNMFYDEKSGI